jgi:hypothetical protein
MELELHISTLLQQALLRQSLSDSGEGGMRMAARLHLALVFTVFARWSKDLFVILLLLKDVCTIVDSERIDNGESQRRGVIRLKCIYNF